MFKITIIASYLLGFDIIKYLENMECESIHTYEGKGTVKLAKYRENGFDDVQKIIITAICKENEIETILKDIDSFYDFQNKNTGIIYAFNNSKDNNYANYKTVFLDDSDGFFKANGTNYVRLLYQVPYGFSDDVILLSDTLNIKGGTVVETLLYSKDHKSEEEYEYIQDDSIEANKRTVSVIIIAEEEKAKQLLELSKNIMPRMFRNKSFKIGSQKLDVVSGLTI